MQGLKIEEVTMKRIIVVCLLFAIFLSGCTSSSKDIKSTNDKKSTHVETKQEKAIVKDKNKYKKDEPAIALSQDEFIIKTFEEYNYDASDKSTWIKKQEGKKTVVIIKEIVKGHRPKIQKIVLLWNNGLDPQILLVMVDNSTVYKNQ